MTILNTQNHLGKSMNDYIIESMEHLCKSPYMDRNRLEKDQLPVVKSILTSYLEGKKAFILEAPTGVGKSIIGIMVGDIISRYAGYYGVSPSTYMLTSSKMLQDQLDKDKDNFKIRWSVLKGQANYICPVNGEIFPKRECKDMTVSGAEKDMPCATNCPYIVARRKAITWDAAIMSYAYWLTSMNFVYETIGDYAPFKKRHITIFDEAHMLSDIVCGMFSTEISESIIDSLKKYKSIFTSIMPTADDVENLISIINNIEQVIPKLLNQSLSVQEMFDYLIEYNEYLRGLTKHLVATTNRYLRTDSKLWSKEQRQLDKESESLTTYCMGVGYFIHENIEHVGMIVKTYDDVVDKYNKSHIKMLLRSLREQQIIKDHCHKYTDFSLFMSATIGDADVFANNNGIENYDYLYIDSNFLFNNSPILQVGPPISMAYKDKNNSMPELMERIHHICNVMHPNEKGIIHTGNFEISNNFRNYLYENRISNYRRFIFYKTSQEKDEAIRKLVKSKDGVIIGPSLMEGLDLKDDLARFAILAKVPYPFLDSYNQAKMKLIPGWYQWKTTTSILQSLGRVIRHKRDWAYTYLLDSCFDLVFKYNRIPNYITKRFDVMHMGMLHQEKSMVEADAMGLFNYSTTDVATPVVADVIEQPKSKWERDLEYYREHGTMPGDNVIEKVKDTNNNSSNKLTSKDILMDDYADDLPF